MAVHFRNRQLEHHAEARALPGRLRPDRAVVELDDGTVLHHDPATDTVTRDDPWRDGLES